MNGVLRLAVWLLVAVGSLPRASKEIELLNIEQGRLLWGVLF